MTSHRSEDEPAIATLVAMAREGKISNETLNDLLTRRQMPLFETKERRYRPLFSSVEQEQLPLFMTNEQRQLPLALVAEERSEETRSASSPG
jgi:hypothetical protein